MRATCCDDQCSVNYGLARTYHVLCHAFNRGQGHTKTAADPTGAPLIGIGGQSALVYPARKDRNGASGRRLNLPAQVRVRQVSRRFVDHFGEHELLSERQASGFIALCEQPNQRSIQPFRRGTAGSGHFDTHKN